MADHNDPLIPPIDGGEDLQSETAVSAAEYQTAHGTAFHGASRGSRLACSHSPCPVLKSAFKQRRVTLHTAAVTTYADALQPGLLQRWLATCAPDCVVALCPVGAMADLVLPLAARFAAGMTAALVPYTFFSEAPASRLTRLDQWAAESRLHLCPVRGPEAGTIVSVWVVVFTHQWAVRRLLRPDVVLTPTLKFPVGN